MYITSTIRTKSSRLAKPVLCLGTLCSAFLTGLNRVSEYRNHCTDVLAGFILGSAVALFLVRSIILSIRHHDLKVALVNQGVKVCFCPSSSGFVCGEQLQGRPQVARSAES